MDQIIHLLNEYGYIVLFLSLMLELIIVPIPNEAIMSYVGVLCYQGKMNLFLSVLSAGLGGVAGVTVSYWIGYKLGEPFFRRFGRFIHMGPEKIEKMSVWYGKYGKVLLLISYFIPGVRHIASIISGIIKLPFRTFAIFSYIGVFLWTGTFIWLGDLMGPKWDQFEGEIKKWLVLAAILIGTIGLCYFVIKTNKEYIKEAIILIFENVFQRFHSFRKIKIIILGVSLLFVSFITLMVLYIKSVISNEFVQFNEVVKTVLNSLFNVHWNGLMHLLQHLSSWPVLGVLSLFTLAAIFFNRKNIWLECIFYASAVIGTYLFSIGVRWLFHFLLGAKSISENFADEKSMLFMTVYGLLWFMLIRHKSRFLSAAFLFVFFIFCLAAYSVSSIYLHQSLPSDILACYVFSAVLVSGAILSMEMFRFLNLIKESIRKID
ncbi:membrane protein DedA, SNARE-associated domain [Bacillus sp. OV322]|uniref:VTT domain-containing protein n=1 Tax=Bacillus sp. OV322 TaxID=1882764 RepID=UPI0008EF0B0B|nr:VTT domain-containing protein [Bacillus sp. OV322]SFC35641.1 membrane protein DedA, SNARE-associated domain [Bacillus sp. OV322]